MFFQAILSSKVGITNVTFEKFLPLVYCRGAFNNYVDKKGGRGGQQKVHACPPWGGSLECPRGPKPSYCRKYFIPFFTAMGGKKRNKITIDKLC